MTTSHPGTVLCMAPDAARLLTRTPPAAGVPSPAALPEWARGYMRQNSAPYVRRVGPSNAATAIIRVDGPLVGDSGWFYEGFFALTHAAVAQAIGEAAADATVARIAFEFDCPGWSCVGSDVVLEALAAARAAKPMIARVYGVCLSGGAWMASMCSEVSASENSLHGSLGALMVAYDDSRRAEAEGVKPVVFAWPHEDKAVGYGGVPWSETAMAAMQAIIDENGRRFLSAVAAGRGVEIDALIATKANVLSASAALGLKLVDVIETQQRWESRLTANAGRTAASPAAARNTGPSQRAKETTMDLSAMKPEDLREKAPDLVRQIEEAAVAAAGEAAAKAAAVPATFAQLKELFGDDAAAIVASQTAGHTMAQARDARHQAIVARLAAQEAELTTLREKVTKAAGGVEPVASATRGAVNFQEHPFIAEVKAHAESAKIDFAKALVAVAAKNPAAHAQYVKDASNRRSTPSKPPAIAS